MPIKGIASGFAKHVLEESVQSSLARCYKNEAVLNSYEDKEYKK